MRLIIKNLKQVPHNVEVENDKVTVKALKQEMENKLGFDANCLKLLYNGVILDDNKDLAFYQIKEDFVLIMMNAKAKPIHVNQQPVQPINPPTTSEKNKEPESNANKDKTKPQKSDKKEEPKPKAPPKDYSKEVANLLEMGFSKEESENAIKSAKGNIALAIDYLYNGIPSNIPDEEQEENPQEENQNGTNNTQQTEIQKIASFAKVLCSQNPNALENLLPQIAQQDPEMMNLIKDHEEEFKTLLQQPLNDQDMKNFQELSQQIGISEAEPNANPQNTGNSGNQISLTKDEFEAVKRLRELGGFGESEAVQAYIACDKNEELAANFLLENKFGSEQQYKPQPQVQVKPIQPPKPEQKKEEPKKEEVKKEEVKKEEPKKEEPKKEDQKNQNNK